MDKFDPTELQRMIKGDREAFQKLFYTFYVPMMQRAAFYVNDITVAEDIAQNMFIRLWNDRHKIGKVNNFTAYLFRWIRNDCLNHIKHRNVADKYLQKYVIDEASVQDADPEPYIIAISNLLQKLPEKRRQVLEMNIFDSKSYQEIASELGISVNTVKDHIKKAYAFLRQESGSIPYPP